MISVLFVLHLLYPFPSGVKTVKGKERPDIENVRQISMKVKRDGKGLVEIIRLQRRHSFVRFRLLYTLKINGLYTTCSLSGLWTVRR